MNEPIMHISAHGLADLYLFGRNLRIVEVEYRNGYGSNSVVFKDIDNGKFYKITIA